MIISMARQIISTGTPWETAVGYSRAVRVGNLVYISGTTAIDAEGKILSPEPYQQAVEILQKIERALQAVGAELQDVVRTRMYVIDMEEASEVTKAHHKFFHTIRPASTLVEVSRLASPAMRVEIEVDAVVQT